ncbi:MAG: Uma2 family endonuclease [Candidatus Rokubacteria bacterium]|nr:Uma2 family endonuclease [Candidatus Rokubacteria bacterium]
MELGFFEGEHLELLDGVLAVREPQGSRHNAATRRVARVLQRRLGDEWQVDVQFAIALDDDSEPQPDVAVVPYDPRMYVDGHPSQPRLVVEVAESSYRIDHRYKSSLYARAGVPEYWIVDVVRDRVEVHRAPEPWSEAAVGWRYGSVVTLARSATVTPLVAPGVTIAVADLLP